LPPGRAEAKTPSARGSFLFPALSFLSRYGIFFSVIMNYFAVQVKTGEEAKFMALAAKHSAAVPLRMIFPRRLLKIRRAGKFRQVQAPLFSGYIFLAGAEVPPETYWKIKMVPGFFRFLKSNHDIQCLTGPERDLLVHFLSYGEVITKSTVVFDQNNRIVVLEGALKGLEGRIIKVDKRKGRAKIKLDMYGDSYLVDLGIEILERIPENGDG
jgi:transcriptional antiterminator NusG